MNPKPTHCAECGKAINEANPSYVGGGGVDAEGNWTAWAAGLCCRKPLTEADFKATLQAVFEAR